MNEQQILHGLISEWRTAVSFLPEGARGRMKMPGFELREMRATWGLWEGGRRNIVINRQLALTSPWVCTREVLLHEIAHQLADEVMGGDDTPHGQRFREACRLARADPKASGALPSIHERLASDDAAGQDRITSRLHKLLALARSANRHEAEAAMAKAHELVARHNIDMLAAGADRDYCSVCVGEPAGRRTAEAYELSALLRGFYFVETVWISAFAVRNMKTGRILELCGLRGNVKMAIYVHDFLCRTIADQWARFENGRSLGKRRRTDFALGLLGGFRERLEAQATAMQSGNPQIAALVRRGDPALRGYVKARYGRLRKIGGNGRMTDESVLRAGRAAGRRTVLHKPVETSAGRQGLLPRNRTAGPFKALASGSA